MRFRKEELGVWGGADDDVAGELVVIEFPIRREGDAELLVDAGEAERGGVEHHGEPGVGEAAEELLAFAEAVAEEDGGVAVVEAGVAKAGDVAENLLGGREDVVRAAEGRLHDEDVGAGRGAFFGGAAGAELEIAGVEEGAVAVVGEEGLGGAVDVAGGDERDGAVGCELLGVIEGEDVLGALAGHAGLHEARGAGGAEDFAVRGDVVGVRVGDEGAGLGEMSVEPPLDLREPDAGAELDLPGHAEREAVSFKR